MTLLLAVLYAAFLALAVYALIKIWRYRRRKTVAPPVQNLNPDNPYFENALEVRRRELWGETFYPEPVILVPSPVIPIMNSAEMVPGIAPLDGFSGFGGGDSGGAGASSDWGDSSSSDSGSSDSGTCDVSS